MTKLYIIRHAEAEGNVYRRCHGQYDSLITPRGEIQIQELAKHFADVKIDVVYSSDLYRTRRTATAIYKPHGLPLNLDKRLRELHMGIWEDKPFGDMKMLESEPLLRDDGDPDKWSVTDAETIPQLQERVTEALVEIGEKHKGETVAVFSHGLAMHSFLSAENNISNIDEYEPISHPDNTSVTTLEYSDGKFKLVGHNDISHLSPGNSTMTAQSLAAEKGGFRGLDMHFDEISPGIYTLTVDGKECGILELDTEKLKDDNIGLVKRYILHDDFRGQGLGIQLLGQAVSVYRSLGRDRVRIELTPEYSDNAGFFEYLGFENVGENVFEKEIIVPKRDER